MEMQKLGMWASIFVCFSIASSFADETADNDDRIVNGWTSGIDQAPWLVSLQDSYTGKHFCGATIIEEEWLLTAAHCVNGRDYHKIRIQMGSAQLSTHWPIYRDVSKIIKAPEFYTDDMGVTHDDIALIKMNWAIPTFPGSNWAPVQVIRGIWNYKESHYNLANYEVTIAGWGATNANNLGSHSNQLMRGTAKLMQHQKCIDTFGRMRYTIGEDAMCAVVNDYGQDICAGDSGSGIVHYQSNGDGSTTPFLIGVATGGANCGNPGEPILMAEVAEFFSWIECKVWNKCSNYF